MVIIEMFVYVFIASMIVVCMNVVKKRGIIKKPDFIYFYVLLSLIILQIGITILFFSPFTIHLSDSLPSISFVCIGVILIFALIYIITHILDSSPEIQEYARTSTGIGMFVAFCAGLLGILIWYPETRTDLNRMPIALALCIGMQYYPPILKQLSKLKSIPEKDIKEQNEAVINVTVEKDVEEHKETIINLAVESWRLVKIFERALAHLNTVESKRYTNQLRWFVKRTEDALSDVGFRIVNVEGNPYEPGMAATPVNIEDFEADDSLVVNFMIEPIIMEGTVLKRTGKVTLRRVEL